MQLSMLIGKQILSPAGELLGYIKSVFLSSDYRKISSLVCIDGEEEEFYLPARAILSVEDAVVAGKARLDEPTGVPCPVGKSAFTHRGELIGTVSDFLCDTEQEPVFLAVREGKETQLPASLICVNEAVMLRDPETKRPPLCRPRKKAAPKRAAPEKKAEEATQGNAPDNAQPARGDALYRCNLLGRRVKRSVLNADGDLIVDAGERVTPEVLSAARRHNRLLQLTVNTLTNIE